MYCILAQEDPLGVASGSNEYSGGFFGSNNSTRMSKENSPMGAVVRESPRYETIIMKLTGIDRQVDRQAYR